MPDTSDAALSSWTRLSALGLTGLTAAPDPSLDRFVGLVRKVLGVPVAMVSLVESDRQVLPGACGLGEPWSSGRAMPLSHSFGQHVVTTAEPMAIADARVDERVRTNGAIAELDVVAYLGVPLTDGDGNVLGSLCAIDHRPRAWADSDVEVLADLAAACSAELRLRIAAAVARHALSAAEAAAGVTREAEDRATELAIEVERSLASSRLLLAASEALTETTTVQDVLDAVSQLVSGAIKPSNVHLALLGPNENIVVHGTTGLDEDVLAQWSTLDLFSPSPSATVVRTQRPVFLADPAAIAAQFPAATAVMRRLGWRAIATAPLGPREPVGALSLAWTDDHPFDVGERAVITALAGYVGHAIARASRLAHRTEVAETLQRALLTPMPEAAGYALAARYRPAQRGEHVGGDWYDAFAAPDGRLLLVVGDVAGHDIVAATQMSQLRSMLRAIAVPPGHTPSDILDRLEQTSHQLGADTIATAIVASVERADDGHTLTWSNAGHMPIVFLEADGTVSFDERHDHLLGLHRPWRRQNLCRELRPGDTVLLFTDGLVEVRDRPIDQALAGLGQRLRLLNGAHPEQLVDALIADLSRGENDDDVAVLAIRVG